MVIKRFGRVVAAIVSPDEKSIGNPSNSLITAVHPYFELYLWDGGMNAARPLGKRIHVFTLKGLLRIDLDHEKLNPILKLDDEQWCDIFTFFTLECPELMQEWLAQDD